MKADLIVKTEINETRQIKISGSDLLEMLRLYIKTKGYDLKIPTHGNIGVSVYVPGGGDWSHQDLEINDENVVTVEWKDQRQETGGVSLLRRSSSARAVRPPKSSSSPKTSHM